MQIVDFPSCCGVRICKDFGNAKTASHIAKHTPEEIDNFLSQNIGNFRQMIAMINSEQYKVVAPVLRKHKFKQVAKFKYAGHGNMIYTYIRIPQKD